MDNMMQNMENMDEEQIKAKMKKQVAQSAPSRYTTTVWWQSCWSGYSIYGQPEQENAPRPVQDMWAGGPRHQ